MHEVKGDITSLYCTKQVAESCQSVTLQKSYFDLFGAYINLLNLLLKSHVHPAQYVDGVRTSMQYLQTTCSVDLVIVLFRVR